MVTATTGARRELHELARNVNARSHSLVAESMLILDEIQYHLVITHALLQEAQVTLCSSRRCTRRPTIDASNQIIIEPNLEPLETR
jgi:hypothetical protein